MDDGSVRLNLLPMQDNANTEKTQMYINASNGIRTYDTSVGAGEDISYLRLLGPCEMKVNIGINYVKENNRHKHLEN